MTATDYYYSQNITYSTGKYQGNFEYGSVSGINNLKKEADVAKLNVGKDSATKNRPAKVTLRQFNIKLPVGSVGVGVEIYGGGDRPVMAGTNNAGAFSVAFDSYGEDIYVYFDGNSSYNGCSTIIRV